MLTVRFLTGFGQRPQHVLGISGAVGFGLGSLGLLWLVGRWFVTRAAWAAAIWPDLEPVHLHTRPVFYLSLAAMILGAQLISMGFLAELFVAFQRRDPASYSVCETTGDVGTSAKYVYSMRQSDRRATQE